MHIYILYIYIIIYNRIHYDTILHSIASDCNVLQRLASVAAQLQKILDSILGCRQILDWLRILGSPPLEHHRAVAWTSFDLYVYDNISIYIVLLSLLLLLLLLLLLVLLVVVLLLLLVLLLLHFISCYIILYQIISLIAKEALTWPDQMFHPVSSCFIILDFLGREAGDGTCWGK